MSDGRAIFETMLERLYASLLGGPVMNCRPHGSRQRIDLAQLARFGGSQSGELLRALLGDEREARVTAVLARPPERVTAAQAESLSASDRQLQAAWQEQEGVLRKMRSIADDANTYERDTGAQALFVGFPLLSVPPGKSGGDRGTSSRRVLAPVAFVPITVSVRNTRTGSISIACAEDGVDRVVPNTALLAWIERRTGRSLRDRFEDEEGTAPWREINELVAAITATLEMGTTPAFDPTTPIEAAPRAEDTGDDVRIVPAAVIGLFPATRQSLLNDMQALSGGETFEGPLERFVRVRVETAAAQSKASSRDPERLVAAADPCQARAVRLARTSPGLVIHGPPGTGKSQTIANVIGDHLARGERVLFVCEKRGALDVVQQRLAAAGLGDLCAVVHDAQRDQRSLYLGIREQLDALADSKTDARVASELRDLDAEIATLHSQLSQHAKALTDRPSNGTDASISELTAEWLAIEASDSLPASGTLEGVSPRELAAHERAVREVLERGLKERFAANPWASALDANLETFLAEPQSSWRERIDRALRAARVLDASARADLPPFASDATAGAEGEARNRAADVIAVVRDSFGSDVVSKWAGASREQLQRACEALTGIETHLVALESAKPDLELAVVLRSDRPALTQLAVWIAALAAYLAIARKWYRWFFFGRRRRASDVLARFGLPLAAESTERVERFLGSTRARHIVDDCLAHSLGMAAMPNDLADHVVAERVRGLGAYLTMLRDIETDRALASARNAIRERLRVATEQTGLLDALRASPTRARDLIAFREALAATNLVSAAFRIEMSALACTNAPTAVPVAALAESLDTVEGLLRIARTRAALPKPLSEALGPLLDRGASADDGWNWVRKAILASTIAARIRSHRVLLDLDAEAVRTSFERYRALESRRRECVRGAIVDRWVQRQRDRLLASTGSRLNTAGADLRRRLMLRGERAMRPREVITAGQSIEGGDPLFDLRPVWMASPETVAQIFPRRALFDVVIFDEASQCRLEEALPVLTRARRVAIAGDPKQLPPTRFFESGVVESSDGDNDPSDQGLFERQQSETEDLLSAALNLECDQSYLDVHYRSANADLIEFSNRTFYDARLQALPGHPSRRAVTPPIRLVRVKGIYAKSVNRVEADEVVSIVRDLLSRAEPPSIGIAAFNVVQRDAILDALEDAAAKDSEFGAKLAAARSRTSASGFEGLFVKNLENVQGDERDHMIVSTTYGPDEKGKFYRRFGPLAAAGGGRRLNVLVTRARREVHLVTSIPAEAYRSLPPPSQGEVPNGGWQLFAYLQFAEQLETIYAEERDRVDRGTVAAAGSVRVQPLRTGSKLAETLAARLAREHGIASEVHWGNDGFCVDVALQHPTHPHDVTIGVLCDGSRYDKAQDPLEWDVFRTGVLEALGWKLHRVWSPALFRDPAGTFRAIANASNSAAGREKSPVHAEQEDSRNDRAGTVMN